MHDKYLFLLYFWPDSKQELGSTLEALASQSIINNKIRA